ncbi:uncharacterized protein [Nicotiana sylvestris]|uniref:RING-type E3 ubiquitin transferase n=2 Tax=Nicotiana TaxID=4085 RepID=A0A1S4B4E4_TOBAC|nr:PREDICTED: E3 ubiquitin ligase BIG BROTHER-related-like [Nicotiana sylvestris]XP_016483716.1 PREDICTED: E3 ubiquitin ligase BIG BROTHER-related-like [Nicotiana tabacum]
MSHTATPLQTRDQVPRHMATTARVSVNYSIMPHCSWVPSPVPHSILDKLDAEIEKEEFGVDISDQYSVNHYVFSAPQSDDYLDDEIEEEEKEEFGVDIYDNLVKEIEEEEVGVDISEYHSVTHYAFPVPQSDDSLDDEIEEEEVGVDIYDNLVKEIEKEEFGVDISEYLETRTYYGPMCDDEEKDACFICAYEYEDEDMIGTLHCGHDFHADCAKKWLLTRNNACPVCSDPVLPIQ